MTDPKKSAANCVAKLIRLLRGAIPTGNGKANTTPNRSELFRRKNSPRALRCLQGIHRAGDIYQIVMSVLFRGRTDVAPFEVYRALRLLNPSPYMFFFEFGDLQVVGSSPEALVKLQRQYRVAAADRRHLAARRDDCRGRQRQRKSTAG